MASSKRTQQLHYAALERILVPRPVDRLAYFKNAAEGKVVFDFGALDETAYQTKQEQGNWLHARLFSAASRVIGFDNSPLVPDSGITTSSNASIVNRNIFDAPALVAEFGKPDIIVAGELIEHLPDTSQLLRSLCAANLDGCELIVSTPNACSAYNFALGLAGRESTHQDHLQIYSYKTLATLFRRCGIKDFDLIPYHARFHEMMEKSRQPMKLAVTSFQTAVNIAEWAAPMLSGGWIVHARLPGRE